MPDTIIIAAPQITQVNGHVTVSTDYLRADGAGNTILLYRACFRFAWNGSFEISGGEAFVTLGLLPAMKLGLPMVSELPVSPGFKTRMKRLMDLIVMWYGGDLKPVEIRAAERSLFEGTKRGTAAFFSCGVDSFHACHTRRSELTHLLFIEGFDIDLHQTQHRFVARRHAQEAAAEMGLPLVVVETDARYFLDRYAKWSDCGSTVAGAVAQLFLNQFGRVILGSSDVWASSGCLSDEYVFTEHFNLADQVFCVDALDVERLQKVAGLRHCPPALRHLRVCWEMPHHQLNCGTCEKCLRTMAALNACGILECCETLPHTINWQEVARLKMTESKFRMWNNVRLITTDREARHVLDHLLDTFEANRLALRMWQTSKSLAEAKGWPLLARKLAKPLLATVWKSDRPWYLKKCGQHLGSLRECLYRVSTRRGTRDFTSRGDKVQITRQTVDSKRPVNATDVAALTVEG